MVLFVVHDILETLLPGLLSASDILLSAASSDAAADTACFLPWAC